MGMHDHAAYETINRKLKQHEQTITQLVNIIAHTNRKVMELTDQYKNEDTNSPLYCKYPFHYIPAKEPSSSSQVPHKSE